MESEGLQNQIAQQKAAMLDNDEIQQSTSTAETSKHFSNLRDANGVLGDKMDCDYTENKSSKTFTSYDRLTDINLPIAPPAPPIPPHLMSRLVDFYF